MWISPKVVDWFHISKESVDSLREELSACRAERDALKLQAVTDRVTADWLRTRINALEMERAGLIEKAYQIKLPAVPQLARMGSTPVASHEPEIDPFNFEDIGNDLAKRLGLPSHLD
jgi:hypothetical protein